MVTATQPAVRWAFREAHPADNQALCRLAAGCPMEADITICVHRDPDFLGLDALLGDPVHVLVAEVDSEIVGCVAWALRDAYVNATPVRTAYIGDLKVAPAHRRRGLGAALARRVRHELQRIDPSVPTLLTGLMGNEPVGRLPGVRAADEASARLGIVRVHSIPLIARRRLAPPAALTVRTARWADVEEMAARWKAVALHRQFARVVSCDGLANTIRRAPGLDISSYRLATDRRGRIRGFMALWDQHQLKTTYILRYSRRQAAFRLAFNLVAPVLDARPLPAPGGILRGVHAFHTCADTADVLRALVTHAHRELAEQDYAFLAIGLDTRDPARAALSGTWAQPTDVEVRVAAPAGLRALASIENRPVLYDTALV